MDRRSNGRSRLHPEARPVQRIELDDSHVRLRLILTAVFLILGAALIAAALGSYLSPSAGWVTIEATTQFGATDADEYVFLCYLEKDTARAESRVFTERYSRACRRAFELFHDSESFDGVNNIYAINRHPNETLTVDAALYDAFSAFERAGSRVLYLGPVYSRYRGLFTCEDDGVLEYYDPAASDEVRREYLAYAGWAADPEAVSLELLGNCQIRLNVSDDYLSFARQEGIDTFIDFAWMKNAFIVDLLAEDLSAAGCTKGAISSYDGFCRCIDTHGNSFSLPLYDLVDGTVYPAAVLEYRGPMSIVSLRDYPLNALDGRRFYTLSDGQIRSWYLDPSDMTCRSALHDLTCLSGSRSCGELLLATIPVYLAQRLDEEQLDRLSEDMQFIWCQDRTVCYTGARPRLTDLYEKDGISYTVG